MESKAKNVSMNAPIVPSFGLPSRTKETEIQEHISNMKNEYRSANIFISTPSPAPISSPIFDARAY
jgi:hypothetical protein